MRVTLQAGSSLQGIVFPGLRQASEAAGRDSCFFPCSEGGLGWMGVRGGWNVMNT